MNERSPPAKGKQITPLATLTNTSGDISGNLGSSRNSNAISKFLTQGNSNLIGVPAGTISKNYNSLGSNDTSDSKKYSLPNASPLNNNASQF
jgi:hypothetical protein